MTVNPDAAFSRGDLMRRLAQLEGQVRQLQTARRLEAATVGRGGVRVKGEGGVQVEDGGSASVRGGGIVAAVGDHKSYAFFGPSISTTGNPAFDSRGLLVQRDTEDGLDVIKALHRPDNNDSTEFTAGTFNTDGTNDPIDAFSVTAGLVFLQPTPSPFAAIGGTAYEGTMWLIPDSRRMFMTIANTTGAANMFISGTLPEDFGQVQRITSSAAFKLDLEDLPVDVDAVLRLRPRTWRDRGEVEREPETDRWHVGLVAEEVDEAGLTEFVDYGPDGRPTAVTYDRLVVALLEVVRQQQARLDALDGGVQRRPVVQRKPKRCARPAAMEPPVMPPTSPRRSAPASGRTDRPSAEPTRP